MPAELLFNFPILTFTCGMKLGSKKLRYGIGYLFIVGILGVCMIGSVFHYLEWSLGITGIFVRLPVCWVKSCWFGLIIGLRKIGISKSTAVRAV